MTSEYMLYLFSKKLKIFRKKLLKICNQLTADLKLGADKCETCQIIAQYLEALLETDAVVVQIEKFLSKGCHLLPESVHTTVCDLINHYCDFINCFCKYL